jgi:hypothetical protein
MQTSELNTINRFIQRVGQMARMKQTDLRLTISEATELCAALAILISDKKMTTVIPAAKVQEAPSGIDGGSFKR